MFNYSTPESNYSVKENSEANGKDRTPSSTHRHMIIIQDDDGNIFKVNGQRLKVFLEPSYNTNLEIDKIDLIVFDKFIQNL